MIIHIKVKPGSSENKIEKNENDSGLVVWVKERAEDNKANIAVIKLLSKYYNVSSKSINIKSGLKNKNKIVEIVN